MTMTTDAVEVDYEIECICDAWTDSEGNVWHYIAKGQTPVEGWRADCPFHQKYPDVDNDHDNFHKRNWN